MSSRFGLFRKYATSLMLLVGGSLVVSGLLEMALSYQASLDVTGALQRSEVRAAAIRIEQYLAGIQTQIQEVSGLPWSSGLLSAKDRRDEYHRLMKLVPAVSEIRSVDPQDRERVKVSRIELDEVDSLRTVGIIGSVQHARGKGAYYSPTYFKDGSEPYLTLAVRDGTDAMSVTLAELNLKFVGEVVSQIRVGREGRVYVVDSSNHLVAHPNLSLVLRKTDLSSYEPLRRLLLDLKARREPVVGMIKASGLNGDPVMLSAASIPSAGWLVVVEQPRAEVLEPVYETITRSALLIAIGLLAALVVSYFLARRAAQPIVELSRGAGKIARGDLSTRIKVNTRDEVEELAREFNIMADQLQDYTTGLERKVAEKTTQLELANQHKSEFLANMSHELRTPLNAIIGFSDVLKERMFGELNTKQSEYVRDIHASGQHLLSLINDILDLSKIEAGRMELDVHYFDVAAALENCRTLIRERAQRQGLQLRFEVESDVGLWCADERKFKQIMLNLLSNAVKFTPPGGTVQVSAKLEGEELTVRVSDTGPGISPADQGAIFEEFRQLKASGEAKHEGTGLGLSLTRRLVQLHGGTITLESEPGRGACFIVRLPHQAKRNDHVQAHSGS